MKPANTACVQKCTLETSVNVCTMVRNRILSDSFTYAFLRFHFSQCGSDDA